MSIVTSSAFLILVLVRTVLTNEPVELYGAGASFPAEVYSKWIARFIEYRRPHVTVRMRYESVGSGVAKAWIKENRSPYIAYAGSDTLLSHEDFQAYPDLKMIPTMAGAVVLAYNIPEIEEQNKVLVLNSETIVGIYNGTIRTWNHHLLLSLNAQTTLPDKEIVVVARSDTSGTTEAFTEGLSSFSEEWRQSYGSFSIGLDKNHRHNSWNETVVNFYGKTNKGMAGLLMSFPYSIGYMSIADASYSWLPYAAFKNRAGRIVAASTETVEDAVRHIKEFGSVMNSVGNNSYPLVSLTYIIIRLTGTVDCRAAIELLRYIFWFYSEDPPRNETVKLSMVPIANDTWKYYMENIVQNMTCNGRNVWEMVKQQMKNERTSTSVNTLQLSLYIGLSSLFVTIMLLAALYGKQQYNIHSELIHDKWKIDYENIIPILDLPTHLSSAYRTHAWKAESRIGMGMFLNQPVTLVRIDFSSVSSTLNTKRKMLFYRDKIKHTNIYGFLGLTCIQDSSYIVHAGETQGSVRDVLERSSLTINANGIIALLKDILKGLAFLHREGIVHGRLEGSFCLLDKSWTVRIAAWPEYAITNSTKADENTVVEIPSGYWSENKSILWRAPELIKRKNNPTNASDVYSYGMVVQEVFTRGDPFSELRMLPQDIVKAVISCSLRPQFHASMPVSLKPVLERCWSIDPVERPSVQAVLEMLQAEYPEDTNTLECIVESIRDYSKCLEVKIENYETQEVKHKELIKSLLHDSAPDEMVHRFLIKEKVPATFYPSATVVALRITNILSLERRLTPQGVINMLNTFYAFLDQTIVNSDILCRIIRYGEELVYASGVPRSSQDHASLALGVAVRIQQCKVRFNREHLKGVEAEIHTQIAVASGSLFAGVCGKVVPVYTVIGDPLNMARELSKVDSEEANKVRIAEETYQLLKDDDKYIMEKVENLNLVPHYRLVVDNSSKREDIVNVNRRE